MLAGCVEVDVGMACLVCYYGTARRARVGRNDDAAIVDAADDGGTGGGGFG